MQILVAREKHQDRYLKASTTEELHKSALALLSERVDDGCWYCDDEDEWEAQQIINAADGQRAWSFLIGRRDAEYEHVSIETLEDNDT